MKKICFVAEYMYCGGSEKSLLSLLKCIDRNKYQITLLLLGKKGVLLSQLPENVRVKVIPLPEDEQEDILNGRGNALKNAFKTGHILSGLKKTFRGIWMVMSTNSDTSKRLWYYKSIENKIMEYPEEFDVVIDYFGYGIFNTFYVARKIKAKKKITWVHFEPNYAIPDFNVFEGILDEYQIIMCVSENIKRQMQLMMPKLANKLQVFYNIVDVQDVLSQARQTKIEKRKNVINILSIGRLDPQKGFDVALKSIEKLAGEGYSIEWNIVGEGPQRSELERQISKSKILQKCVVLHGQQINPYIYMNVCDIYFQPSRHEGYGIAVAEARAFCKPIVVTDFAGAKEQLVDGKTGIITKCSEGNLYEALKELIDHPALQEQFSQKLLEQRDKDSSQVKYLEEIFDNV